MDQASGADFISQANLLKQQLRYARISPNGRAQIAYFQPIARPIFLNLQTCQRYPYHAI